MARPVQQFQNPHPIFLDAAGRLVDGAKIYVGTVGSNPRTSPIPVYWDIALSIPATQPLRTLGGKIVNGVTPSPVFVNASDYSYAMDDADDAQIDYSASTYTSTDQFQPRDSDLDAIATLGTTPFGRSLLALADQAALKTATGIPTPLPIAGGALTGNVTRQGAGGYPYFVDATLAGRIFVTEAGAADPTSQPGDLWFEKA